MQSLRDTIDRLLADAAEEVGDRAREVLKLAAEQAKAKLLRTEGNLRRELGIRKNRNQATEDEALNRIADARELSKRIV